ncbi:MAG: multidrug efflux SMR transporter [Ignavibacteria bacterium]|nr:multidrug efflux SMR transporter [Ignavibacteria bacterium]
MAWTFLIIAAILEIGWPLGLKLSQTTDNKIFWIVFAAVTMIASGYFLWLSQKTIPIGTAYVVWTGIGAVGAFVIGILKFDDPVTAGRIVSALLIVAGVIGLKLSHS